MEVTTSARKQTRAGRFYDIDGIAFPSVTTILTVVGKPALINWAAKVEREMCAEASTQLYLDAPSTPKMTAAAWKMSLDTRLGKVKASQKELTKAGEIGSQVHALIEWSLKGELLHEAGPSPRINDAAQWAFFAYEDWRKKVNLKPIYVEQVVFSRTHGYAGTLDLLAEVNGVLTVIDFKTGKAIYAESALQNAAYRHALREMKHGDAVQGLIVRLPKNLSDPEFEVAVCPPEKDCMEVFLHAKKLWEWSQKNDTWKAPEQNIEKALTESLAQREGIGA